jgi:hypothetical protein
MPKKTSPKTETVRKSAKSTAAKPSWMPLAAGGLMVGMALVVTVALQNTSVTSSSSAAGSSCGTTCSRDSQCGAGLTCKAAYGTRKTCTCTSGNCIQGQCILPKGDAELGDTCDQGITRDDRLGKPVPDKLNYLACKEGLQCLAIATMNGNITVCCDPTNPNYPANCVDPQLRQVAPRQP